MQKLAVRFWSLVLILIGLLIAAHKIIQLEIPLAPGSQAESWTVQSRLSFRSNNKNVKAKLYVPNLTPNYSKLNEFFISGDFGLNVKLEKDNKSANWTKRRAKGEQTLYYRTTVTLSNTPTKWTSIPNYPKVPEFTEPYSSAVEMLIKNVRSQSADIASFTFELIDQLNNSGVNENIKLIRSLYRNENEAANTLIKLLAVARIPARKLWAIPLSNAADYVTPTLFIQSHNGDEWITFNIRTGNSGLPENYLAWKVGKNEIYKISGANKSEIRFSVTKSHIPLIEVANHNINQKDSLLGKFTLSSLPVHTQITYSLLLMVPLGALLIVFMRTFVGVQTFGTFMPVLIAIAFRETQLFWGIILFSLIVSIGLLIRFYLERLRLLLIPRLAAILVVVVILMLILSFMTSRLGLDRLLSISLFPMVILAMTIERMSITWEENGAQTAILQGLGSLLVASLGYLIMTNGFLSYMMFAFPELLLIILGICLWMGRYTGYRLSEFIRFREIGKN